MEIVLGIHGVDVMLAPNLCFEVCTGLDGNMEVSLYICLASQV